MSTDSLIDDLRQAFRTLRRNVAFNATIVAVLAMGIGVTSAVFGLLDALLLRPPGDLDQPERIVAVFQPSASNDFGSLSYPDIVDIRRNADAFEAFAARVRVSLTLGSRGETSPVVGEVVSSGYFAVMGTSPAFGRGFRADEEDPDAAAVAVLSDSLWRRAFDADPGIIGRSVVLNGRPHSVVGVAPPSFRGGRLDEVPEIWMPVGRAGDFLPQLGPRVLEQRHWRAFEAVGRLREGVAMDGARAALAIEASRLDEMDSGGSTPRSFTLLPVRQATFPPAQRGAVTRYGAILVGVVTLILLVVCLNIANLMLVRGALRGREIAVRKALGAARSRIVRQLLFENLTLAALGGAAGLLVFRIAAALLLRLDMPVEVASAPEAGWRVLGFTAGLSLAVGALFGLWPALRTAGTRLYGESAGARGATRGATLKRLNVSAQVAGCTVLLVMAGLLLRTVTNLGSVDVGFRVDDALAVTINPEDIDFDEARGRQLFAELLPRLRSLPGVVAASFTSDLPLGPEGSRMGLFVEGHGDEIHTDVKQSIVAPDFFRALGMTLLAGRDFTARDESGRARNTIVNQAFAERFWPGQDPLGKGISVGGPGGPFYEVIGVVGNHRHESVDREPAPHLFWAFGQIYAMMSGASKEVAVRTEGDVSALVALMRAEIAAVEPDLPVPDVAALEDRYRASMARQRHSAGLLSILGGVGLLLAATGIYGLTSFITMTRCREIGIRMALGASPGTVLRAGVADMINAAGTGVLLGLVASLAASRLVASLLFGVPPTDVVTYTVAAAVMLSVAALGAAYPAWRASRADPSETLRPD